MKLSYTALSLITLLNITQPSMSVAQPLYEVLGTISDAVEPQLLDDQKIIAAITNNQLCFYQLDRNLPLNKCLDKENVEHFRIYPNLNLLCTVECSESDYIFTITQDETPLYILVTKEEIIPINFYFGRISNLEGRAWLFTQTDEGITALNYEIDSPTWYIMAPNRSKGGFCLSTTHSCIPTEQFLNLFYLKQLENGRSVFLYIITCRNSAKHIFSNDIKSNHQQQYHPVAYNSKHNFVVDTFFSPSNTERSFILSLRPEDGCFKRLYDHDEHVNYLASNGDIVCAAGATKLTIADITTGEVLQTIEGNYKDLDVSQDGSFIAARDEDNNIVVVWQKKD